jgi:hypothetical protein
MLAFMKCSDMAHRHKDIDHSFVTCSDLSASPDK